MLLLIDADTLVYKAAGAAQHRSEHGYMEYEHVNNALHNANTLMNKICVGMNSEKFAGYLTQVNDKRSFRKNLFNDYKAHRIKAQRPRYYKEVRNFFITKYDMEVVEELEADDMVGIKQYEAYTDIGFLNKFPKDGITDNKYLPSCIVGIDKDLDQIPGLHYNYDKEVMYYITPLQGMKNFYKQILGGDVADNIPRIKKGWREKKAFELIDEARSITEIKDILLDEVKKLELDKKELNWRGEILWLKRSINDEFERF